MTRVSDQGLNRRLREPDRNMLSGLYPRDDGSLGIDVTVITASGGKLIEWRLLRGGRGGLAPPDSGAEAS